jgi:exoribonuclease-2
MERFWCLQYLIQENSQEVHATVWRENLVRLDTPPYMTKVYGLPEMKPGTRIGLNVQEVDPLLMELRCKFIAVLPEAPLSEDALSLAPDFLEEAEVIELTESAQAASDNQPEQVAP